MPDTNTESVKTADPTGTPEQAGIAEGGGNGTAGGEDPSVAPAGGEPAANVPVIAEPAPGAPPVHVAIANVIARLPAIEKGDKAPAEMGGYAFRGIERIMSAAQKILADEGVVFYGQHRLTDYEEAPRGWSKNDRTHRVWTETTWTVLGPAGDKLDPAPVTQAYALDGSDKGLNKAHTQSKKYMLMDLLQIADAIADADGQAFDPGPERQAQAQAGSTQAPYITAEKVTEIVTRIKALPEPQRVELAATWAQEDPMDGKSFLPLDPANGKPAVRYLRETDVPAVEALILRLAKAGKEQPESVADRAKRMAAEQTGKPAPEAAQTAQDEPQPPAADAGGEPPAETVDGATEADALADIALMVVPDDWGDLADKTTPELIEILAGLRRRVPSATVKAIERHVSAIKHPVHVNDRITVVPGQTVGDDEPIDHRRMRVMTSYLCGWLTEHQPPDA